MQAGVWLVELAPVAQGSFVPGAVARVLNVQESPNRPLLETMLGCLKQKTLLLILDNCEHVIAEAADLADALLHGCPPLRILATSREPLRILDERTYLNYARYCNPHVDLLLSRANASYDDAVRRRTYIEARQLIAADAPDIPMIHGEDIHVVRANVSGFRPNGSTLFDEVLDLDVK